MGNPFFRVHDAKAGATTLIDRKSFTNFSSYDYLGLNGHPAVSERPKRRSTATAPPPRRAGSWRASGRAIISLEQAAGRALRPGGLRRDGQRPRHQRVDHRCPARAGDLIFHDALAHNSIVTGAQLSGAERRSFPHNDLERSRLCSRRRRRSTARADRGRGPLQHGRRRAGPRGPRRPQEALRRLADGRRGARPRRARPTGAGLFEQCGVDPSQVDIWMGTLSKTLSSCGGYIAGSIALIEYLK